MFSFENLKRGGGKEKVLQNMLKFLDGSLQGVKMEYKMCCRLNRMILGAK